MKTIFLLTIFFINTISFLNAQNFDWAKQLGGKSNDDGRSLKIDAQGNVYLTGAFRDTFDFDPGIGTNILSSFGGADIFVTKFDPSGNHLWTKQMGGTNSEGSSALTLDADGNIIVIGQFPGKVDFNPGAGTYYLTPAGNDDIFVVKLDGSGNFLWANKIGGTHTDLGSDVSTDAAGNIYLTGSFRETADFDPGVAKYEITASAVYDAFVMKLNSKGNFCWANKFGGGGFDNGSAIALDAAANVYSTGKFQFKIDFNPGPGTYEMSSATLSSDDVYISKLDSAGKFIWAKQLGGTPSESSSEIVLDSLANIYTTGTFTGTSDFDPSANTFNLISAGSTDVFISKLDSSGNFIWAKKVGGPAGDYAYALITNSFGNILCAGSFTGKADFDPGSNLYELSAIGASDIFIFKLNASGDFQSAVQMGGPNTDHALSIAEGKENDLYITGSFQNVADFDPSIQVSNLSSAGLNDIFITRLTNVPTGILEGSVSSNSIFTVNPNPFSSISTIELSTFNENVKLNILNIFGQKVRSIENITANRILLERGSLPTGIYFIYLTQENKFIASQKFMIID